MGVTLLALLAPPNNTGELVSSIPMAGLTAASDCKAALPTFGDMFGNYVAPQGTLNLTNDGGWCSLQFTQTLRQIYVVPDVRLIAPPSHGEVVARKMPDRIAVAYRPAPEFVGTDHFAVRTDGPLPHTIPVDVTVR